MLIKLHIEMYNIQIQTSIKISYVHVRLHGCIIALEHPNRYINM